MPTKQVLCSNTLDLTVKWLNILADEMYLVISVMDDITNLNEHLAVVIVLLDYYETMIHLAYRYHDIKEFRSLLWKLFCRRNNLLIILYRYNITQTEVLEIKANL